MTRTDTHAASPVCKLADVTAYREGSIVSRSLLKKRTGSVTVFAFGRGEALSEHTAPCDALLCVIDGRGEVEIAGEPYRLGAGETILLPGAVPHAVRALEDFRMLLIMLREPAAEATAP